MASSNSLRQEGSASTNTTTLATTACPECEGRLVSNERETYCRTCGLVVDDEWVDEQFTRSTHGQLQGGSRSWSVERTTGLRVDKALATTFYADTDGRGNSLSGKRREFYQRLRRRHKRFQMESNRAIRLNEALKDVELIGKKLELPRVALEDAARIMRRASEARLPGGHMAWESLAGGAVLLAAAEHGWARSIPAVARLTKTDDERLCAAARKLRLELGLDVAPARDGLVDAVLDGLAEDLDERTGDELAQVGRELLDLADERTIAPGTPRATAAGAAVYAADRLTSGKALTQAQVAAATDELVATTKSKIARYSRRLHDAATEREMMADGAMPAAGDD